MHINYNRFFREKKFCLYMSYVTVGLMPHGLHKTSGIESNQNGMSYFLLSFMFQQRLTVVPSPAFSFPFFFSGKLYTMVTKC